MKKAVVVFLMLAVAAAGLFAQEEEQKQGLSWGGAVKTGLRLQTSSQEGDEGPGFGLYNDDAGEVTRIDLNLAYTKNNYGVIIGLRTNNPFALPSADLFRQGYVWADFLDKLLNLKVGKIDDNAWATTGPEEFGLDLGGGLRLEVKPIEGLNIGFFINGPDEWFGADYWDDYPPLIHRAEDFFLETAFGIKYESKLFDVAAGLRLDGEGDGIYIDDDHYTEDYLPTDYAADTDFNKKGMSAWVGFGLKAVENLTFTVEGLLSNLGGFSDYGWIWLDEVIEYAITDSLTAGIRLDQFLYGNSDTGNKGHNAWLKFEPGVGYALTDAWTIGLSIPIAFQSKITDYDIGVKPKVSYKLGENASIDAFYKFAIEQPYGDPKPDSFIKNTIQIDFIWTF